MSLKNNFKKIRMTEFMMSSTEFAKMLGISNSSYSNWELNISKPTLDKAIEVAQKLNKTIEEIWYLE